jgi:hypothetical protein
MTIAFQALTWVLVIFRVNDKARQLAVGLSLLRTCSEGDSQARRLLP